MGIQNRDRAQAVQLASLLVEKLIAQEIDAGISAEKPYKEIYQSVKDRLDAAGVLAIGKELQA